MGFVKPKNIPFSISISGMMSQSPPRYLAIFIFQTAPTQECWEPIQQFIHTSMGVPLSDILHYDYGSHPKKSRLQYLNISDDPAILFVDMMRRMLDDLRRLRDIAYHTTLVYIENTLLCAYRTDVDHDVFWYRYFDIIQTEHIVFLHRDAISFDLPLFTTKALYFTDVRNCETEIIVETTNVDMATSSRCMVIDNISITEFCDCVWMFVKSGKLTMDILEFTIEQTGVTKSIMYTNFTLLTTVCFMYMDDYDPNQVVADVSPPHRYFVFRVCGGDYHALERICSDVRRTQRDSHIAEC